VGTEYVLDVTLYLRAFALTVDSEALVGAFCAVCDEGF
jgi:hypothetical protein